MKDGRCGVHAGISGSPGVFRMKRKTTEGEDIKEPRGQSAGWTDVWILKPPNTMAAVKVENSNDPTVHIKIFQELGRPGAWKAIDKHVGRGHMVRSGLMFKAEGFRTWEGE